MFDGFDFILFWIIFLIYAPTCLISTIFTFSIERYKRIEEKLNFEIISNLSSNPLDKNIDWFNRWMVSNNKKAGPILILLSLMDLKLFFDLLNNFQFPP